ncbi:MAG: MBL fold metallo-hydrolase [Treponema sp.]|nr:MBL fold metallo-hydrolase [Treponema sp.]
MNLHLLHTGPLSVNTYIVPLCGNKVFVIDPADCAFCGDEGSVRSFLQSKNLEPFAVILTHGHFDHVAGLSSLKKSYPNIQIAIHKDDGAYIGENSGDFQAKSLAQMGVSHFLPSVSNLPSPTAFLKGDETLSDTFKTSSSSSEIKDALSEWQILHTPGHTEGSCCLYNEEKRILISGDTLFYRSWGRTDLAGGSEKKIQESLLRLMRYCEEDTVVYSGHDSHSFIFGENFY